MDIKLREIDFNNSNDINFILNARCSINYECESDLATKLGYELYSQKWFSSEQPNQFLNQIKNSSLEKRNITVIGEKDSAYVAYLWVNIIDIPDFEITISNIIDIYVAEEFRNCNIASDLFIYAEQKSKMEGASIIRSGTGYRNIASINLHKKSNFSNYRIVFEKFI